MAPSAEKASGRHKAVRTAAAGLPAMRFAAATWWAVAMAGQAAFGAYIVGTYGVATLTGRVATWNRVFPTGYVRDQPLANLIVAVHVLLAAIVACCGGLQLIPALRRHAPWFHRWNGRIYATVAIIVGLAGLVMMAAGRDLVGASQNGNVAINGVLLLACAVLAWQRARAGDFAAHRRWALRLFVLAAGVWLFRIGLASWIAINGGVAGFDPRTMRGPALLALAAGEWIVPLLVLEAYLRAEKARAAAGRYAVATLLVALAALTGFGVYRALIGMWLPLMLS
ncbi:DUF2306 domain-containing protein [Dyella mobilis]|uniref:DUF2306 domain-containing protein n=1 Tax=Dyella mobilis TaxID=1849582 RepID=A0ABS2KFF8_9GAMM|nr:DUF2306 domain-containing protein [Dyella mobilis]MBM7129507.1 DUF2306 domain-containing protein [Dyella mobilis]